MHLSGKINLIIVLGLSIFFFIGSVFIIQIIHNSMIEEAKLSGKNISAMFANLNSLHLFRMDYYSLENNVKELTNNENIVYAEVRDLEGFNLTPASKTIKDIPEKYILPFEEDIMDINNEKIGSVKIGISIKDKYDKLKNIELLLFVIISLSLLMVFFTLKFFINAVITKPIANLLKSVKIISEGDLEHQVEVSNNDEIGILAKNFNLMTKKLQSSHALIQNIIEYMPSALISIDELGKIIQWNRSAEAMTGIKSKEVYNRTIWTIYPDFQKYYDLCKETIISQLPTIIYREKLFSDPFKFYNIILSPLTSSNVKGLVIRIDDITELEKKEAQLRQAQKMETVGTLAGGLAHDFNNVLGGIIGTLSVVKFKMKKDSDISPKDFEKQINIIDDAANRAKEMVQQLLSLSRKKDLNFAPVDLNKSIENVLAICENTFDKKIKISLNKFSKTAIAKADSSQIEQVMLNLCLNGYHAMTIMRKDDHDKAGTLQINLNQIKADRFFCETHPEAKLITYWMISIRDTGVGMEQKLLSKIFDPFFTTKDKEHGTGLGLAMVYNIIKQHEGFVDVYSEVGLGTTFNIYLPILRENENLATYQTYQEELKAIPKGSGTILIVDDEEIIRNIAKSILAECGYNTMTATNGLEALELYEQNQEKITAVLLDMVMPLKSGKETYIGLKSINNSVKVLLSSGFKQDERVEEVIKMGVNDFLQKPYTLEKLATAMHKVIYG